VGPRRSIQQEVWRQDFHHFAQLAAAKDWERRGERGKEGKRGRRENRKTRGED